MRADSTQKESIGQMIRAGQFNTLKVLEVVEYGVYLDGGEDEGKILLPRNEVPADTQVGDKLDVFILFDAHDDMIATTKKPAGVVGEFVNLKVVSVNSVGAFADWGLNKDILIPFSEQRRRLEEGDTVLVRIYIDRASGRIVASTKFNRFLDKTPARYKKGEQVNMMVGERSDLGFKVIIENAHWGMLFSSDVFGKLFIGKRLKGYVKSIRSDGKIDISLQAPGRAKVDNLADKVMTLLEKKGGYLPLSDKSSPEAIFDVFRTSKATYKQTIGALYKQGRIVIDKDGIRLRKD